jgi:quercetin dioxygenase-like cupin family protein
MEAGVGLRELSRLAEVSAASLTAIEKDKSSPTLATLHKILKALGTNFADFFANSGESPDKPVFAGKQMKHITDGHREYALLLPKRGDMRFEMVHETILQKESKVEWEVHDCDVGGIILTGGPARLEIEGQGEWTVRKGDSFYIKSGLKHRLVNHGNRPLMQVTVMAPPRY